VGRAEAIRYVRAVADCDLYWIEEPFEEDFDGLKRLKDAMTAAGSKAMIADGERRQRQAKPLTRHGGYVEEFTDRLYRLAEAKLVDVFVLDLGIVGFTRWRKLMPELISAGIKASPHLWMWTPRTYYCAQLAAGVGNVCIIEGIPGEAPDIDYSAYKITDGSLVVPETPGFGLKLA
jgi:D-galactarolactone cycloisomerase